MSRTASAIWSVPGRWARRGRRTCAKSRRAPGRLDGHPPRRGGGGDRETSALRRSTRSRIWEKRWWRLRPDFLVDVTVPSAHCEVTLAALAAGVPVLGEKPMADSMADARRMVAASEARGGCTWSARAARYDARVVALMKLIREHVGALGMLTSDFFSGHISADSARKCPARCCWTWPSTLSTTPVRSAGLIPLRSICEQFNPAWSWFEGDACATALFEMTGGLRYTYRGSWCAEGLGTSWHCRVARLRPAGVGVVGR